MAKFLFTMLAANDLGLKCGMVRMLASSCPSKRAR